ASAGSPYCAFPSPCPGCRAQAGNAAWTCQATNERREQGGGKASRQKDCAPPVRGGRASQAACAGKRAAASRCRQHYKSPDKGDRKKSTKGTGRQLFSPLPHGARGAERATPPTFSLSPLPAAATLHGMKITQ